MASFPASVWRRVVLLVALAVLQISSQVQAEAFQNGEPTELQYTLLVGRSMAVQLVATRAGAEVNLRLQVFGGAVCGNIITITGVEDGTGNIYWENGAKATAPRLLWTSFRKGDKHTLFMHRRTTELFDVWLEQSPLQVYTFQSPGCPSTYAIMTIAGRGATLESIALEPPRQDNTSLAVGEQVLLSARDGFLQYLGLCGEAACSALRLHGVTEKQGLAYTTVLTANGEIDSPGRVLTEHGPWAFCNANHRNTVVVHRRSADIMAVWLQSDPLRVAAVRTAPDWDQLRFQPKRGVVVHYDTALPPPPPTATAPTAAPATTKTKPSPKATTHNPFPVTTESKETESTTAARTTQPERPATQRTTQAGRASTAAPPEHSTTPGGTSGTAVSGGGGSLFCIAVTIVFLLQR